MNKKIDYEKKMKELEEIVSKMEDESTSLDESLLLYQKGNEIIKELESSIKEAETKIKEIIEVK